MDKTQEEKFEDWFYSERHRGDEEYHRKVWEACLEANGIGEEPTDDKRYRIGEAIEYLLDNQEGWKRGHVGIIPPGIAEANFNDYRRIPAWNPKYGEAVLFYTRDPGCTLVGVYARGAIHAKDTSWPLEDCHYSPFDVDGHGKPWGEI